MVKILNTIDDKRVPSVSIDSFLDIGTGDGRVFDYLTQSQKISKSHINLVTTKQLLLGN